MKLILIILGLTLRLNGMAQSQLDSLIHVRNTAFITGKVPTYYSPGNKAVARDFQNTITAAINYFEKKYTKKFQLKLVVLDSAQWLYEIVPFGLIFYNDGWIVMNAGLNYQKFADMYGLNTYYAAKELQKAKLPEKAFINSVFKFYSIHELGHYFINELSKAASPDKWTNEFTPTYLAYDFFKKERGKELLAMQIFSAVSRDHYAPSYSSISNFNTKYVAVGIPNYIWYHSNFYFLTESLYRCKGTNFFSFYEQAFPKSAKNKPTAEEVISILDKGCSGLVSAWVKEMAAKAKN